MPTATITIAKKELGPSGSNDRGNWQVYRVFDGNEQRYTTFKQALYSVAEEGKRYHIEYDETDKGNNLTAIEPAVEAAETPALGTGDYVTGKKPIVEVRRIFASTAWNCASSLLVLDSAATLQESFEHAQHLADWIFADLLRKGRAMEDEDIPF